MPKYEKIWKDYAEVQSLACCTNLMRPGYSGVHASVPWAAFRAAQLS